MNTLRCIVFVTLVASAAAQCGLGLSLCNGQCYSPSGNSCPTDQITNKQTLCPLNFLSCNGACYSSSQYYCANGGLQAGVAPNKPSTSSSVAPSTSSTAAPPTTSSTQAVTSSSTQAATPSTSSSASANTGAAPQQGNCGAGLYQCGGACYSPSQYCCPNGQLVQAQFCPSPNTPAPSTSSQPKASTSSTSSSQPKASTSSTSSQPIPTSSTTSSQAAAASSTAAAPQAPVQGNCGSGLYQCGGACYSPSQYCCPNGQLVQFQYCGTNAYVPPTQAAATTSNQAAATSTPTPVVNPSPVVAGLPKQTADLRIINSCKSTLWFEARYGGQGAPIPGQSATASIALPGSYVDYTIPATGLGGTRFWAKYGCDVNGKNCLVGDQMQYWPNPPGGCPANGCTPPVDSLFEATWGCRPGTGCNAQNPTTWFDTSQVDGWTIPYKLTPNGDTSGCDCVGSNCGFTGVDASRLDLAKCPKNEDLRAGGQTQVQVNGQNVELSSVDLRIINNGSVIGCLSPCKRMNWGYPYGLGQPENSGSTLWMCCPTPTPENCSPDNGCVSPTQCRNGPIENTAFVKAVHTMAPGIYSYSYDDGVGLHACPAGVVTYTMEFCPAGSSQYPAPA